MTTKPKTCFVPVTLPGGTIPAPCGDRVVKAGRCKEHYADWRNERESRRGTEHRSCKHQVRREECAKAGVVNSGRQWRKLRKSLARGAA